MPTNLVEQNALLRRYLMVLVEAFGGEVLLPDPLLSKDRDGAELRAWRVPAGHVTLQLVPPEEVRSRTVELIAPPAEGEAHIKGMRPTLVILDEVQD